MDVALFGVNHRAASVARRERLALDPSAVGARLARLPAGAGLREALLVSTCNRTEVYAATDEPDGAVSRLGSAFLALTGGEASDLEGGYFLEGTAVCRHAMRVAAGLDSLVLGERQILGQVKEACVAAREAGTLGPLLDRLFSAAFHAAKRVQAETELTSGAVSVASAAIVLAEKVLGSLAGRRVVVVGAGETAALAARHLAERRPGLLSIVNRTFERAGSLAQELGARVLPLSALGEALAEADLVLTATRAAGYLISAGTVRQALGRRDGRSLVLVDIAVPRNVEPEAGEADGVFVYSIDALSAVVDHSLARRRREAVRAEAIVEEEVHKLEAWMRSLETLPVVRELREYFEQVRADEVRRSLKHFPPGEQEHVERLTKALVNKLLHTPTMRLKTLEPEPGKSLSWVEAARGLFALGGDRRRQGAEHGR